MLDIVIAVASALISCGFVLILHKIIGRKPHKWLLPATAGFAMFAAAIWSQYNWVDRKKAQLADNTVILSEVKGSHWMAPWTYVWKRPIAIIVADQLATRRHPQNKHIVLATTALFPHAGSATKALYLINCNASQHALLTDEIVPDKDGMPTNVEWQPDTGFEYLYDYYCAGN